MIIKKGSIFITTGKRITDRFCKYLIINDASQNYVDGSVILFDHLDEIFAVENLVSTKIKIDKYINEYQLRIVHSNEMFHFVRFLLLGERIF